MKRRITLLFLATLWIVTPIQAQSWRSELYPENWQPAAGGDFYTEKLIQDFSFAGYHRGEKDIPSRTQNVLDVTKPPYKADNSGNQDVTAILQRAIRDAGQKGGGVVFLPKGTFKVSPDGNNDYCLLLEHSQVVLRGAETGQTFLYNSSNTMRGKAIIKMETGNSWAAPGPKKKTDYEGSHETNHHYPGGEYRRF